MKRTLVEMIIIAVLIILSGIVMADNLSGHIEAEMSLQKNTNFPAKKEISYIIFQNKLDETERFKKNNCIHDQQCIINNNRLYYVHNNSQKYKTIRL